jgi:hypothetical protein
MKPIEKAKSLLKKFTEPTQDWSDANGWVENLDNAKECCLILINERLDELKFTHVGYGKGIIEGYQKTKNKYWQEVKAEIERMVV